MGLMNGGLDDSDDEDAPPARAQPRANAPAKSSNLNPGSQRPNNGDAPRGILQTQPLARPAPAAAPGAATRQGSYDRPQYPQNGQQQQGAGGSQRTGVQRPAAAQLRVDVPPPGMPRAPMPAFMHSPSPSPSLNPHPLNAPSTPITPVFARPSFQEPERKVEFAKDAIMRGNSEETLLPRNTPKGEEFWRRFSVVAKEDPKRKKSKWLSSTMGNSRSMTRWIWCISIFLLLAIGAGIGFGWYFTHNNAPSLPVAIGGSANESQISTAPHTTAAAAAGGTSRTLIAPLAVETKRSLHARRDHSDLFPTESAKFALPTERAEHFAQHRYHRRSLERLN